MLSHHASKPSARREGLLLVLAGVSGAGKSHFTALLVDVLGFTHVPSTTTRAPRIGETHGVDRNFCSEQEFLDWKNRGLLVCERHMFGNWYGLDKRLLPKPGDATNVVCQLRYNALEEFKLAYLQSVCVYIVPADLAQAIHNVQARELSDIFETQQRFLEFKDEIIFIEADRDSPSPLIAAHFVNDYTAKSDRAFLELASSFIAGARG